MDPNFVWSEVNQDWVDANYGTPSGLTDAWDFSSLTQGAKDLVTAFNSFQLQQINLQRAQKGLPALNPAVYSPQVGLNLAPGTMNMIMLGAVGLAAIMLLKRSR